MSQRKQSATENGNVKLNWPSVVASLIILAHFIFRVSVRTVLYSPVVFFALFILAFYFSSGAAVIKSIEQWSLWSPDEKTLYIKETFSGVLNVTFLMCIIGSIIELPAKIRKHGIERGDVS